MSDANILVLTHGSALELLQHYNDMFYFARINLVVVDECHHATKKHTYTNIFEQFYHNIPAEDLKPRVLGLTATPIINVNKNITDDSLEKKLMELENILDSEIVSFSCLGLSLEESGVLSNNRSEHPVFYEKTPIWNTHGYPDHENIELQTFRKKELRQLSYLLEEYGPVVVWHYSAVLIREVSRNLYEKESEEQFAILKTHLERVSSHCKNITKSTGGKTEKLVKLEQLLKQLYSDGSDGKASFEDTVGIIFVKQRISALSLKHYFNLQMLSESSSVGDRSMIRSGLLTRNTTHVFKYLSSTQKLSSNLQNKAMDEWLHTVQNMKQVLNTLRSREINLLFATSVVEEGVDIDACSFVIILDELQTTKSYIQTRGRARQLDAKFFVFENSSIITSKKGPLTLNDAKMIEEQVSKYLGTRKSSTKGNLASADLFSSEKIYNALPLENTSLSKKEEEAVMNGYYRTKNGMVDLRSSKGLINRYCSCIPMDIQ